MTLVMSTWLECTLLGKLWGSLFGEARRGAREEGLTLVELLVVISTIGVLAALAIPSFSVYKRSASYAVSESTVNTARISLESSLTDIDRTPAAVAFASQNTPGMITDPAMAALLPNFALPKNLKITVAHDPACLVAGCQQDLLQADHCGAEKHARWVRYGDGEMVWMDHQAGANCQ